MCILITIKWIRSFSIIMFRVSALQVLQELVLPSVRKQENISRELLWSWVEMILLLFFKMLISILQLQRQFEEDASIQVRSAFLQRDLSFTQSITKNSELTWLKVWLKLKLVILWIVTIKWVLWQDRIFTKILKSNWITCPNLTRLYIRGWIWKNLCSLLLLLRVQTRFGTRNYLGLSISFLELRVSSMLLSWPIMEIMGLEVQSGVLVEDRNFQTRWEVG